MWSQGCTSWYQTATGKNTNNWPGFTLEYRQRTRRFDLENYTQVQKSAQSQAEIDDQDKKIAV